MRKKEVIAVGILSALLLCSCSSGVSQEDYNKIVSEKESLAAEKESLTEEKESLAAEKESLADQFSEYKTISEEMRKDYEKLLLNSVGSVNEKISNKYIEAGMAWATASFDGNVTCASHNDSTLLVSVFTEETPSEATASDFWEQFKLSAFTYAQIAKDYPKTYPFNLVCVDFYTNDNDGFIQFSFTYDGSESTLKGIMSNISYLSEIDAGLN